MFDVHGFIMKTVKGMIGNYPDFQVREYALKWYSNGKITENDLEEVEKLITKDMTVEENIEEASQEAVEEVTETSESEVL